MLRYNVAESKQKWSFTWPVKPGRYWAWGERFRNQGKPELMYVEVFKCANGIARVTKGSFLYVSESGVLLWTPAFLPNLPTAEQVQAARDEFNATEMQEATA